jgi:DNA-directed RNA polymerase subunit RPC12/RpoP
MDNHDFLQIYQTMKVNEISDTLKAIKNRSTSPAALEDFQKETCALVFDVHEEFTLIERNLKRFPLWSALRLLGLEIGLRGQANYADFFYANLEILESHVPSDPISFPFKRLEIYPIDQKDIESLEFKKLLSDTHSGIQRAIKKFTINFKSEFETAKATIEMLKTVESKKIESTIKDNAAHNLAFNMGRGLRIIYIVGFIALFIMAVILFNSFELVEAALCFSGLFILYLFGPWFACKAYIAKEYNLLKESGKVAAAESKRHEQDAVKLVQDYLSGGRKTNEPAEEDSDEPSKPKFIKHENGSIHFECSYCSQPLEIDETGGGTEIKCPECGERQKVPTSNRKARSHPNQ